MTHVDPLLFIEQALNGVQLGVMLFLMAAGLTLVFGVMNFINLAHGSFYMLGAFFAVTAISLVPNFVVAAVLGIAATVAVALVIERLVIKPLHTRDHLSQVLATFGLILLFNELVRMVWGSAPQYITVPAMLSGTVEIVPGSPYPVYRLAITGVGLIVGAIIYVLITHTRAGMLVRAGASNRQMAESLGVNVTPLFTFIFGLGSALAGLAGIMVGPILSVEVGMGEPVLILTFVVIVIGGSGSVRGAFVGALLVGLVDTFGRFLLPQFLGYTAGPALSSMSIYVLMAAMLFWRPLGLFPVASASASAAAVPHAELGRGGATQTGLAIPKQVLIAICVIALVLVPVLDEPFYTRLFTRMLIFGLAALSLDIIMGFGGMVSFGHAAFLGVGAYTVGVLSFHGIGSGFIAWPAAIGAAALASLVIGAISLRTSGVAFIMITLAFAQMLYFFGISLEKYGGDDGMSLAGRSSFGGVIDIADPASFYYLALAVLAIALYLGRRLINSRFGMVIRGAKANEQRMLAIGFPCYRYKLAAFTLAGGMCGLAGAMLANVDGYVGPSAMHWFVSGELMVMVILGGAATLVGPIFGAMVFVLLEETLSGITEHWMAVFGPLLILVVMLTRGGVYGWLTAPRRKRA